MRLPPLLLGPHRAAGLFNTSFQIGGAIVVAIVSAVISSHTRAVGGGGAQGILAAMRPTLAILIAVAVAGVFLLFALLRVGSVPQTAEVLHAET